MFLLIREGNNFKEVVKGKEHLVRVIEIAQDVLTY